MKKGNRSKGLILSIFLLISTILSAWVVPLPVARAEDPDYSWATFTIAASGDDVTTLANSTWSNYTTDGDNLWSRSKDFTTRSWLRFEGLDDITSIGGIIDQIILSMYSGTDAGEDYTETSSAGLVSVSCPLYTWDRELSEGNLALFDMNPIASFDGDNLSPSGAWYNKTISNTDPRDWYAWNSDFDDVFTCYVGSLMSDVPDYTYWRGFTSQDEGNPAKLYVKYHIGEGYEEVLSEFEVSSATYVQTWNNYNYWEVGSEWVNYSTFTVKDFGDGTISITDETEMIVTNIHYNSDVYAVKDCTDDDFTVRFGVNTTELNDLNGAVSNSWAILYGVSNQTGWIEDNDETFWVEAEGAQDPLMWRYRLISYDAGHTLGSMVGAYYTQAERINEMHYLKLTYVALTNVMSLSVYSDPEMTNLIESISADRVGSIGPINYHYAFAPWNHDSGNQYTRLDATFWSNPGPGGYVATAPNGTVITPDPFEDFDDCEDFVEDWDEEYGPVLAISIANVDATEWVFEGNKRYEFTVIFINVELTDIEQVGVGFSDEINNWHSVWYDYDANTLTVTSPEDSISGWLSSISQTSTNVTAVFQIMFNIPIPDSYDVSAYGRIVDTSDSGWTTPEWGEAGESGDPYLFNIYNLGGLSTLTKSGTAGRITGGDIFEIYAADTRTNIAGTQYFDVRDDPLSWYNVLTNEDLLINEMPSEWEFNIPRRKEATTIRLTNNLPENRTDRDYDKPATSVMAYVSYPFSMRLLSDPYLTGDYQIGAELELPREITIADEILKVQAYLMTPNSTTTTGAFRVRNGTRLTAGTKILTDVNFNGNGTWASYNSTGGGAWLYYGSYAANTWYNVTVVVNMTGAIYDIFIDDAEVVSNLPYRNPTATTALIVEFTQNVPAAGAPADSFLDMYVDNVRQWTSFDADYGGSAEATMLFKQLQHWSMDFDFFIENGEEYAQGPAATPAISDDDYSDYGYIELGWDIMIDDTWVNDFLLARVNITDGQIAGKNDWVKFNVTWYNQGSYVKNDMLYGLFEGYSLFPGSAKDTTGFHWDMWFNRANASTVVGARINTEYFGMSDKSVWWAVWSSKWQPMRTEVSDSTIFVDLQNAGLVTQSAKDVLFVRSWVKVYRTSDSTFAYKILNIGGLDFLVAIDTMSGIDTPPVRETKVPDVVSGFLGSSLGSIFSAALKRLGNAMAGFGMDFFTMSIDFMDNVFAALGYPALVSTIFGWMDSFFASVPTLVGYGVTLIGQIFLLVNTSAGNTLTQLTSIITIWIGMYSTTMDLLTGVLTPGINLWNDLGVNSFIQIGAILYPFWLIMMGMEKGTQAVFDHLNSVLNIGSFFLNFILNVAGFFMGLMDMLIGAIRG